MKTASALRVMGVGALALSAVACAQGVGRVDDWRHDRAEQVNESSFDVLNLSSDKMVEKYGPPDRVENLRLAWDHRGPWKRIVVWDEVGFHQTQRGLSNIEETIVYAVPPEKRGALASFSLNVHVSPDGRELSARSSSEERNYLLLNLADEIVSGRTSPEDARERYFRTLQLAEAGKTSASMQRLLFQ